MSARAATLTLVLKTTIFDLACTSLKIEAVQLPPISRKPTLGRVLRLRILSDVMIRLGAKLVVWLCQTQKSGGFFVQHRPDILMVSESLADGG